MKKYKIFFTFVILIVLIANFVFSAINYSKTLKLETKFKRFNTVDTVDATGAIIDINLNVVTQMKKLKLETANTNAKLVFAVLNEICANAISNGSFYNLQNLTFNGNYASLSTAKTTADKKINLDFFVREALEKYGLDYGALTYQIDYTTYKPVFTQWADATSTVELIGQYPNPETDPDAMHAFGNSFG